MRSRTITAVATLVSLVSASPSPPAQQTPRFEVASVKRNTSGERGFSGPRFQGTTVTATNVPLQMLITAAYGIPSMDLIDSPRWIFIDMTGGDRFDVVAKSAEGTSVQDQRAMLRNLLEDRFALRVRREARQLPVYTLTTLDERGRLGPNLRRATKDCLPRTVCEGRIGGDSASYKGAQWSIVFDVIRGAVNARVIDRTGLSGTFDFELIYSAKGLSTVSGDSGVDIFGAVQQQLGLKLDEGRAPFEIAVVESVQREPTPD